MLKEQAFYGILFMDQAKKERSNCMDYEKLSKEELIEALKESQDLNKKLLDLMEIQNNKFTEISIKALEEQIKSRHNFLAELEQSEPPKLFKSLHRDWENKVHYTKKDIEELDKKLFEDYTEYGEFIEKMSKKNKDSE